MMADRYLQEMRRYYYVTPTSYLILIKTFRDLLDKKRKTIDKTINKFDKGLDQLAKASQDVEALKEKLNNLIPQLKQKSEEAKVMMEQMEKQKIEVAKEEKIASAEKSKAEEASNIAAGIKAECDKALAEVIPIYEAALSAVKQLSGSDVTEMKSMSNPSDTVRVVAKTLCLFFDVKPDKKRGQTAAEGVKEDYWDPCKKKVLNASLLKQLQNYDKDNVDIKILEAVKPILSTPEYQDDKLKNASKAAWGIAKWVRAIVQYDEAMKIVKPKKAELAEANEKLSVAKAQLKKAEDSFAAVQATMQALEEKLIKTQEEETRLKNEKNIAQNKVELAESLLGKLDGEKKNWEINLAKNRADKLNLVGDVIISSGVIAYLGVFTQNYRTLCIDQWVKMMKEFQIQSSDNVSLKEVLGNKVQLRSWNLNNLPSDDFSADNAIIMENSDRWPLIIDP